MQALLPYLFILACPVGMGLMMWMMMRMNHTQMPQPTHSQPLNAVEGDAPSPETPPLRGRTRDEQVAELRARLEESQAQQEELARELARQERAVYSRLAQAGSAAESN